MPLILSDATLSTVGVLLVSIVAIEWGGHHVLSIVRGNRARTPLQIAFARAGHAHAGVLVILSLVALPYVDASGMAEPIASIPRSAIPLAAILMPAGFFLASAGAGRETPSRLIWLVYAGSGFLAAGVLALGIGLLGAPSRIS